MQIYSTISTNTENVISAITKKSVMQQITPLQKKVMLIAGAVFALLLISIMCYKRFKGTAPNNDKNQSQTETPKTPKSESSNQPQSEIHSTSEEKQNATKLTPSINQPKISAEQKIIDDYTPEMVEALGGVEKVLAIPYIEEDFVTHIYNDKRPEPTTPVLRGKWEGKPALLFHLNVSSIENSFLGEIKKQNSHEMAVLFRSNEEWQGEGLAHNQLIIGSKENPRFAAIHMLARIERLVQGKHIGVMKSYPRLMWGRDEDIANPPQDAYLMHQALIKYMEMRDVCYYETKIEPGVNEITLYSNAADK